MYLKNVISIVSALLDSWGEGIRRDLPYIPFFSSIVMLNQRKEVFSSAVLRIRDVHPVSRIQIFPSRIKGFPDPHPHQRIWI